MFLIRKEKSAQTIMIVHNYFNVCDGLALIRRKTEKKLFFFIKHYRSLDHLNDRCLYST